MGSRVVQEQQEAKCVCSGKRSRNSSGGGLKMGGRRRLRWLGSLRPYRSGGGFPDGSRNELDSKGASG